MAEMLSPRPLGSTGLSVPPLVFGGNVFGWTADAATSFSLLDACMDAGLTAIDTADVYSRLEPGFQGGESETVIGAWLKARGRREEVTLFTKVGLDMGEGRQGLSRRHIRAGLEASLGRLNTDYIDVYWAHWDDPSTPLEETLTAFEKLLGEGKIKAFGASNYSPARLAEAVEVARAAGLKGFRAFQARYNLYDRAEFERDYAPVCRAAGLGALSYFSLASGFLSGKHRAPAAIAGNKRAMWLKDYFTPRGEAILATLDTQAARLGATPAELSLAWLMTRPDLAAPIASATRLDQFEALAKSCRLELDAEALQALDAASAG